MSNPSREVLHVYNYENVLSQSVLNAETDKRVIHQLHGDEIYLYRQGGEDIFAEWTYLATLGSDNKISEESSLLANDFLAQAYLTSLEETGNIFVSVDDIPTEHRKLQASPGQPTGVFEAVLNLPPAGFSSAGSHIRGIWDAPVSGSAAITEYKMEVILYGSASTTSLGWTSNRYQCPSTVSLSCDVEIADLNQELTN